MNTERLIARLAEDLRPAPALRRPWARAVWWLLGTVAYLGILTIMLTSRADVAANGAAWTFVLPQVAAILTAAASVAAALASTVPGFPRRVLVLPAGAAMVWLGSLIGGAAWEWNQLGTASVATPREWLCVAVIVLGSALPGLAIGRMLRKGAPLTPRLTAALGALAAAALANVAACVSNPHLSSAVTLVWHGSAILALLALAVCGSHLVLTWETRQRLARRQLR